MATDPVRLARIRARLLAAATLAIPACGPQYVNDRPPDRTVDGPINERAKDEPTTAPTSEPATPADQGKHINTPPPDQDINRPNPDAAKTPDSPTGPPPIGQTINVAEAPQPHHINTPKPSTK